MKIIQNFLKVSLGVERLFFFIVMFLLLVHIVTCVWILQAQFFKLDGDDVKEGHEYEQTWMHKFVSDEELTSTNIYYTSFYWCITTITTVGYGDVNVAFSDSIRIALSLYILFSYAIVGKIIGLSVELVIENKRRALRKQVLQKRMSCEEIAEADADGSGELGESEFVLFKLQQMELVSHQDLYEIKRQFWELDVDGNGSVSLQEAMGIA